jgi:hypothetical protein
MPTADDNDGASPLAPAPSKARPVASLTAPTDSTDGLMAMALRPAADPLVVPPALQEASEMGAWLSTKELAELVGMSFQHFRHCQGHEGVSAHHCPRLAL